MKVLIIGIFLKENLIEVYNEISTNDASISVAAVKYTQMINLGFEENLDQNVEHLFLAPIGMYPRCRTFVWSRRNIEGISYIKFINIIFFKQLTIALDIIYTIFKWNRKNKNHKRVVVFTSVYLPFLFAVLPFKFFSSIKFVSFVPDLPEHSFSYSQSGSFLKKIFIPFYIRASNALNSLIDYYVFITKYMSDIYPNKSYTVIEGFAVEQVENVSFSQKANPKAIMYSGALFKKFGIKNLIDAFMEIDGAYELWLFGTGDMTDEIIDYTKKDTRIKYFGHQPNTKVLSYQKEATLLINPRFSHEEFTKYSFPSKLMEYLSSGTPVLTTRLLGIPDDYQDKFYFIEDESKIGFKKSLETYLKKNTQELEDFGHNGRDFVLKNKSYNSQIKKLIINLNEFFAKND